MRRTSATVNITVHIHLITFTELGLVIAAGPGRVHPETALLIETAVSVGDKVIYGKYDGSEIKYNGDNHQLIKDDDILLKV